MTQVLDFDDLILTETQNLKEGKGKRMRVCEGMMNLKSF